MAKKKTKRSGPKKRTATTAKKTVKKRIKKSPAKIGKKRTPKVGRPKISGDEKLFMLFHDNYHARQIFEFLRVETVRELEEYSPQEIIQRLSKPIADTVEKIRQQLAEKNRYLSGDAAYAAARASD